MKKEKEQNHRNIFKHINSLLHERVGWCTGNANTCHQISYYFQVFVVTSTLLQEVPMKSDLVCEFAECEIKLNDINHQVFRKHFYCQDHFKKILQYESVQLPSRYESILSFLRIDS